MPDTPAFRFVASTLKEFTKKQEITGSDHLIRDLELDSIDVMDALAKVEDEYGLVIPSDILPRLRTVDDLVQEVEQRLELIERRGGKVA